MATRVRAISTLIAVILVLTSAQCVMSCAVADCHERKDVAPCHQGQHGHNPKTPLACSHDLRMDRTAHLSSQISDCNFSNAAFTMTPVVPAPIIAADFGVPQQSHSPPDHLSLSAVVLRI